MRSETDSKVYDAIKQSQSTKDEPLIFIITTEGTTVGGSDNKLDYVRRLIKVKLKMKRYYLVIYSRFNWWDLSRSKYMAKI